MPLLLADFIYSRDCKLNLRKNVDTTFLHLEIANPENRKSDFRYSEIALFVLD